MGIRFSPGCECCDGNYLAICYGAQLPFFPNVGGGEEFYIDFGVQQAPDSVTVIGPFVPPKRWTVLASNSDLYNDAIGNNPGAQFIGTQQIVGALPFNSNIVGNSPQSSGLIPWQIRSGLTVLAANVPVHSTGIFNFIFLQFGGSKGKWNLLSGHASPNIATQGETGVAQANFTVKNDGSIL